MTGWLASKLNYGNPDSWINRVRRRRAEHFRALLETLPVSGAPATILDVGGTYHYWRTMGLLPPERIRITLLNLTAEPLPPEARGFASQAGDGKALPFADKAFDVVFSNSAIEHMGSRAGQQRMADEVRRVGKRYYVQTPAKWFPLEPHCRIPCFQFLPRLIRAMLIRTGHINYFPPGPTLRACAEVSDSTILLSASAMRALFPEAHLLREWMFGLVKSYTAVGGWPTTSRTSDPMRIALIGSRGIPACYSGFETFYEQLAVRLAARGHDVTVYNRRHFIRDVRGAYKGVRIVSLPCIRTKHLETLSHTLLSSVDALFRRYDIAYYCIVGNAPLAWLPRLTGARTLLNVDGEDWAREKWGAFARWYQRHCERLAVRTANVVIADALAIRRRYREDYGAETVFVPYGANIASTDDTEFLKQWQLEPGGYFLFVGRFVPENAIDLLIKAFARVRTGKKLVLVGDAPYMGQYKTYVHSLAGERVVFTGYVFGDGYAQLSSHAYAFAMPSGVDGTRPVILDQLAFGNCVLARDSVVNAEVLGSSGMLFDGGRAEDSLAERLQEMEDFPDRVETCRAGARSRIRDFYNWEKVVSFYEDLFERMMHGHALRSYDDYLAQEAGEKRKHE